MHSISKGTVFVLAAQLLGLFGGVVYTTFASIELRAEDRGFLALLIQLGAAGGIVLQRGYPQAFLARGSFVTDKRFHLALHFASRGWVVHASLLLLAGIAFALGAIWLAILVLALLLNLIYWALAVATRVASVSAGNSTHLVWAAVHHLSMIGIVFTLVALDVDEVSLWYGALGFPSLLFLTCLVLAGSRRTVTDTWRRESATIREVSRAGRALEIGSLATWLTLGADRILIPLFFGLKTAGLYAAVIGFFEAVLLPLQTWFEDFLRRWTGDPRQTASGMLGNLLWVNGAVGFLLVFLSWGVFSFIQNFLGEDYQGSKHLILPLSLGALAFVNFRFGHTMLVARGAFSEAKRWEIVALILLVGAYILGAGLGNFLLFLWTRFALFAMVSFVLLFSALSLQGKAD